MKKPKTYSKEWYEVCKAFAEKENAKLLFVNDNSCGIETKNGKLCHIYAEEMLGILEQEKGE